MSAFARTLKLHLVSYRIVSHNCVFIFYCHFVSTVCSTPFFRCFYIIDFMFFFYTHFIPRRMCVCHMFIKVLTYLLSSYVGLSPAYAAPPPLVWYANRPFGHQRSCSRRLAIELEQRSGRATPIIVVDVFIARFAVSWRLQRNEANRRGATTNNV